MSILHATDVIKKYGDFAALDGFSCEIPQGITGLLGPNGAGKTTFIRSLLGLIPFEEGSVSVLDDQYHLPKDILTVKDLIGYMPEKETRMHRTNAMKYVSHFGRLAGLPYKVSRQRAFDVLHYVGLEEARYREMNTFSSGMLQRVKLATALVQDPAIIILDEPTAGMDPQGREQMLNLITDLGKKHEKNIIFSTHLLPDIEKTSNYAVVINRGRRVMQGDLQTLMTAQGKTITLRIQVSGNPLSFVKALGQEGLEARIEGPEVSFTAESVDDDLYRSMFRIARGIDMDIRKITPNKLRLEDVFIDAVNTGGQH